MNPSALFIKKPTLTVLLMVALLLFGLVSFRALPVTDLPNVDFPLLSVTAEYPGASPEVMVQMITTPLEKELAHINGLKHIASQSSRGFVWMTLMFDLDCNLNVVSREVEAALRKADPALPQNMSQRPSYSKANAHQESIIYLVLTGSSLPLSELYDYAHAHIEQAVASIEGVGKVEIHGSPYAVRIALDPEQMAARGLTFDQVRSAIAQASNNAPLGVLETPNRKFSLDVPSRLQNAADFANLTLAPQVRLKEIATVTDGLESHDIFHYVTKEQDQLAVILGVQKTSGANVVKISEQLKKLLPEIQAQMPPSMQLKLWFNKANWIQEAIEDVEWSLVLSFALVVLVVFLSLGHFRETLVAATALPLSIIGTFIIMQLLHFNLDLLSLMALTLAMGFVIDDAIVVLENIVRHREMGLSPFQAALQGSKEISFTVLSMTLSLVAVFIPMLFMQDVIGKLFREFSITLAVSILVSGVVSLTATPMLASRFLSAHAKSAPRLNTILIKLYERSLSFCLRYKKSTLSAALALMIITVMLFRFLPINLFPEEERSFVWGFMQLPSGMSKSDTELFQNRLSQIVQNHPAIEDFAALNFKDYQVYLLHLVPENRRATQAEVIGDLQTQMNSVPGAQIFMKGIQLVSNSMGEFTKSAYQMVIRGANSAEVRRCGEALKQKLAGNALLTNLDLNIKADSPKLDVTVFETLAEKLGLTRQTIQSLLQSAYAGVSIGTIERNSQQNKIFLELDPSSQKNSAALSKLYVTTPTGSQVPLKAVATWNESVGLQAVDHLDLLPAAILSFDVPKGADVQKAFATIKAAAAETLSPAVTARLEGVAEMVEETRMNTLILLLFAFMAMYVVLGVLYESFIHPLTILSALPFACLGGMLTLLLFQEPLSLYGMLGFLLLIGIVKKNGIMMVDYALEIQKNRHQPPLAAIKEACLVRFRPIMMTTVAAVMGAVPIAIGIGAGSETRKSLGLVIAGGLIFSQFLTLYITPIIYLYLEKLRRMKTSNAQP